jgi:hypothetical protein
MQDLRPWIIGGLSLALCTPAQAMAQCFEDGAQEGVPGLAVVCDGEDYWLPQTVGKSPHGAVLIGNNSVPLGRVDHDDGTRSFAPIYHSNDWHGYATSANWKTLEEDVGEEPNSFREGGHATAHALYKFLEQACVQPCEDAGAEDCSESDLREHKRPWAAMIGEDRVDSYGECRYPDFEPPTIHLSNQGNINGNDSPSWLDDFNVPTLFDAFGLWCEQEPACDPDRLNPDYRSPHSIAGPMYDASDAAGRQFNTLLNLWTSIYQLDSGSAYLFNDALYLGLRFRYLRRLLRMVGTFDVNGSVAYHDLNSESGELPLVAATGFMDFHEIDAFARKLALRGEAAADSTGTDPGVWAMNLAMGGRAFRQFANEAWEHRFGVATHGTTSMLPYQFLQHLPQLRYDERDQTYAQVSESQFAFVHSDLTNLHKHGNSVAQFRQLRMSALATIALGATRLVLQASGIPSKGAWQDDKCDPDVVRDVNADHNCQFDYGSVEEYNAYGLMQWMTKNIGHGPSTAPEAYCLMVDYGADMPAGRSFKEAIEVKRSQEHDGMITDTGQVLTAWPETYLRSPRVSHLGRHCRFDLSQSGAEPAREMQENYGDADPPWNYWGYGGRSPHEARTPEPGSTMFFDIDDAFSAENNHGGYVVKVVFAVNAADRESEEGTFRLYTSVDSEWTASAAATVDPEKSGISTATFHLDHSKMIGGGPSGADLGIQHVNGARPDILLVRVIPRMS